MISNPGSSSGSDGSDKTSKDNKDNGFSEQTRLSGMAQAIMLSLILGNLERSKDKVEFNPKDVKIFDVKIPVMKESINKVKEGMKISMDVDVSDVFVQRAVSHCVQTCFSMVLQFGMISFYSKGKMPDEERRKFSQSLQNIIDDFDFCSHPSDPQPKTTDLKDSYV